MATSGKKSLVRDIFWWWQSWQGDCSVLSSCRLTLGLPSTCWLQEMLMFPALWSGLPVARSSKHLWGFSLPWALTPFGILLVSGLRSPSQISQDLETRGHISHVFGIQMLWSKLSSELRLNHPSFSVNTRATLPGQPLRCFQWQLYVLARVSALSLFHHAKKNKIKKWKTSSWFHVSYSTTKEVHLLVCISGQKVLHSDVSSD